MRANAPSALPPTAPYHARIDLIDDTYELSARSLERGDKDFMDFRSYVSNAATGALAYANMYPNSDDGRRLWAFANVAF